MRHAGVVEAPVGYEPRDHLCWVYDHEPAWIDTAVRYLAEGARGNDQILYVADKPDGALVDDLAGLPFRDSMLHSGQLEVLCLGDAYNATRGLVAIDQIAYYRSRTAAVTDAGCRGSRLACEASSLAATPQRFAVSLSTSCWSTR